MFSREPDALGVRSRGRDTVRSRRSTRQPAWCGCRRQPSGSHRKSGRWVAACCRADRTRSTNRCRGDEVGAPDVIGDVPLRGLGIVVVADLGEVALLPQLPYTSATCSLVNFASGFFERSGRMASGMRLWDRARRSPSACFSSARRSRRGTSRRWMSRRIWRSWSWLSSARARSGRRVAARREEEDQLPTGIALLFVRIAPGRHTSQTNAMLDDVVKLPVGKVLRR